MERSNVSAQKYVILTSNYGTNTYYNYSANLRVDDFPPNSNGVYKITVNEINFHNDEATLRKDEDYLEYSIYVRGEDAPRKVRFTMNKNVYTYRDVDRAQVLDAMTPVSMRTGSTQVGSSATMTIENWPKAASEYPHDEDGNLVMCNFIWDTSLKYINPDGDPAEFTSRSEFFQSMAMVIAFPTATSYGWRDQDGNTAIDEDDEDAIDMSWVNSIYKVELNYSSYWGYVLNNLNYKLEGISDIEEINNEDHVTYQYWFNNLRVCGPYFYVIQLPAITTVKTFNEQNKGFNIVGLASNEATLHNSCIKMCSSMESTINELSNFRIELLDDQFMPVKVISPIQVQLTISNEG